MAYEDDTTSVQDSAPIELYEIDVPGWTYRMTSYVVDVVHGGFTYTATPGLKRGPTELTSVISNAQEVTVTMPNTHTFVMDNVWGKLPRSLKCRIYILEQVSGQTQLIWEGRIAGISAAGRLAQVLVPLRIDQALSVEVPSVRFQPTCNHALYDARCRVPRLTHDFATTVLTVSGTIVTVNGVAGFSDQHFKAGELVRDIDGERRLILDQVGTIIRVDYPMRALLPGDSLTLFAGCDHTPETCRNKFFNISNFGGHPHSSHRWVRMPNLVEGD
jgi:uncharacterized phage protein (TIGR02218 family)